MCLGKCIYSIEGRESYKPWISHLCITVQLWPTFDENLPLFSMENKVSSLMWPGRFRIQKFVSAPGWDCCWQHPPPPSLPITHFGHGSEHRQCGLWSIEPGMWMALTVCIHRKSPHLRMWFQLSGDSYSESERVCLSHYLWVWRDELHNVHFPRWSETRKEDKWGAAGEAQM